MGSVPGSSVRREADDVAAGFLVALEVEEVARARVLEQLVEGAVAVIALVEAGFAALQCLLDHRAPDGLVFAALVDEGFHRFENQVQRFLELVVGWTWIPDRWRSRGVRDDSRLPLPPRRRLL